MLIILDGANNKVKYMYSLFPLECLGAAHSWNSIISVILNPCQLYKYDFLWWNHLLSTALAEFT